MKDNKYDFINLTLDSECAMKNDHDKIIFDIAWTVCNINKPNFEFLHKKRFIVKESYENINHWIFRRRKDKKQYDFDESRYMTGVVSKKLTFVFVMKILHYLPILNHGVAWTL